MQSRDQPTSLQLMTSALRATATLQQRQTKRKVSCILCPSYGYRAQDSHQLAAGGTSAFGLRTARSPFDAALIRPPCNFTGNPPANDQSVVAPSGFSLPRTHAQNGVAVSPCGPSLLPRIPPVGAALRREKGGKFKRSRSSQQTSTEKPQAVCILRQLRLCRWATAATPRSKNLRLRLCGALPKASKAATPRRGTSLRVASGTGVDGELVPCWRQVAGRVW